MLGLFSEGSSVSLAGYSNVFPFDLAQSLVSAVTFKKDLSVSIDTEDSCEFERGKEELFLKGDVKPWAMTLLGRTLTER